MSDTCCHACTDRYVAIQLFQLNHESRVLLGKNVQLKKKVSLFDYGDL